MAESFLIQDIYLPLKKNNIRTEANPLKCYVCKKELDGLSITAKTIKGMTVFLCSNHFKSTWEQIISVS